MTNNNYTTYKFDGDNAKEELARLKEDMDDLGIEVKDVSERTVGFVHSGKYYRICINDNDTTSFLSRGTWGIIIGARLIIQDDGVIDLMFEEPPRKHEMFGLRFLPKGNTQNDDE